MDKNSIKRLIKSKGKNGRAIALTLAVSLIVANPLTLTGCEDRKDKDQGQQQQEQQGGTAVRPGISPFFWFGGWGRNFWSGFRFGGGGYSGSHGGSSGG